MVGEFRGCDDNGWEMKMMARKTECISRSKKIRQNRINRPNRHDDVGFILNATSECPFC